MKTSTLELLGRGIDLSTELTDAIRAEIKRAEYIHDKLNPGTPLSVAEIVSVLMFTNYHKTVPSVTYTSPSSVTLDVTSASIPDAGAIPKRRPGRPPGVRKNNGVEVALRD